MNEVEDIKQRLDIVDIVKEHLELKKAGSNYKARCPFHQEKTPSFMVSQPKQIWHCFGCHEGGDVFTFVQKMEGLDFYETLKILAQRAGVTLTQKDSGQKNKKQGLLDIIQSSATFFHKIFLEHPKAEHARQYLKDRKISESTIKDFRIGYAPDSWETLFSFLKQRGYLQQDIVDAGLVVYNQERNSIYDRFRNRITIPLADTYGNIVGFTARQLDPNEKSGKYINTPQTAVYDKSRIVFGIDKAKMAIKDAGYAVIVEGNMDVVSSHQAGVLPVVAVSGTAFTENQIMTLKRFTNTLIFAFDADSAGQMAARRGIELALRQELNVKVLSLPQGKDPDDVIREDVKLWQRAIEDAVQVMDHIFSVCRQKYDVSTAQGKKSFAMEVLSLLLLLPSPIEKEHHLQRLSAELNISLQSLSEAVKKIVPTESVKKVEAQSTAQTSKPSFSAHEEASWGAIALCMISPSLIPQHKQMEACLANDQLVSVYKSLKMFYSSSNESSQDNLDFKIYVQALPPTEQTLAVQIQLYGDKNFSELSSLELAEAYNARIQYLKRNYWQKQLELVQVKLKAAEQNKDEEQINVLIKQFSEITQKIANFE